MIELCLPQSDVELYQETSGLVPNLDFRIRVSDTWSQGDEKLPSGMKIVTILQKCISRINQNVFIKTMRGLPNSKESAEYLDKKLSQFDED